MNQHLSQEEFAECYVDPSRSPRALRHLQDCSECSEELGRFRAAVLSFRGEVRARVEYAVVPPSLPVAGQSRASSEPSLDWRWIAVVAAAVLFGLIPALTLETRFPDVAADVTSEDASALMDSINLHLSRDLPAPMEPMMVVFPDGSFQIDSGGTQ